VCLEVTDFIYLKVNIVFKIDHLAFFGSVWLSPSSPHSAISHRIPLLRKVHTSGIVYLKVNSCSLRKRIIPAFRVIKS
jgi:hypothetical protein